MAIGDYEILIASMRAALAISEVLNLRNEEWPTKILSRRRASSPTNLDSSVRFS